jgi:hypothetical protein
LHCSRPVESSPMDCMRSLGQTPKATFTVLDLLATFAEEGCHFWSLSG